jgi:hypothetical protein
MQFGKKQNYPGVPNGAYATGEHLGRHPMRIIACLALMTAFACAVGPGQTRIPMRSSQGVPIPENSANPVPDANQQMLMHEQQAKKQNFEAVNAERKKIIAEESALLLKLATDLKTEVDKTNKDQLSLTVIRKAEIIEKLAHDVKEKMKITVGSN